MKSPNKAHPADSKKPRRFLPPLMGDVRRRCKISALSKMFTKKEVILGIVIPIVATLLGAAAGSYWSNMLALSNVPEKSVANTLNLLGLVTELKMELPESQLTENARELLSRVEEQARALEANLNRLKSQNESISLQADFWLAIGEGGTLGGTTPFGLQHAWNSGVNVRVSVAGEVHNITAGQPVEYNNTNGDPCSLSYVGEWKNKSSTLYGFQARCISET